MGFLLFNSTSQVVDLYVVYLFIFIMGLISEKSLEVKVFIPLVFMNFRGNQTDNGFLCMVLFLFVWSVFEHVEFQFVCWMHL